MKKAVYIFIWSLLAVAPATGDPKLKVGMLLPLSGPYAAVGADNRKGVEVALEESADKGSLEIVYADSRAEPHQAVSEFRRLTTAEGVSVVIAFRGPVGMAVNPISKTLRIPLLGGVGNKDFAAANPHAFQIWTRSDEEGAGGLVVTEAQ